MGSETRLNTNQESDVQPVKQTSKGVSPLLVLFFISGMVGLGIAVAALLANNQNIPQNAEYAGPAQVIDRPSARVRAISDWQADDFTLVNLDGDEISLSDYAGQIIFLNLWRTDCPPCVRELPALADFHQSQGIDGAVVLAVNQGENEDQVREFLAGIEVTGIPVLLDADFSLESDYPIPGFPTTYIIDTRGYVAYSKIGELTEDEMNEYVALLESEPRG